MPLTIRITGIKERPLTTIEDFASKFVISTNGCWEWVGRRNPAGYGIYRSRAAHRSMWELVGNPVDLSLQLDHLCRNTRCINPKHLEQVTARVNTLRGNTISARNAAKTHCYRGHALTGDNVRVRKKRTGTERQCVACGVIDRSKYYFTKYKAKRPSRSKYALSPKPEQDINHAE